MKTSTPSLLVLMTLIIITSCSKSDGLPPAFNFIKVDSIQGRYLIDQEKHTGSFFLGIITAHFEYQNNKLSKRRGGYIPMPASSGYTSPRYSTEIYDSVHLNSSNLITLVTKYNLTDDLPPKKTEITFANGMITKKITFDEKRPDTIYYFYDSQRRLKKTEQYFKSDKITKEYTFDDKGNLKKITTIEKARYEDYVNYTSEELFGGYDNKPNPLKGLCLWQDLFYRSLSNNNFTTYSYTQGSYYMESHEWKLTYDQNGNADFSK